MLLVAATVVAYRPAWTGGMLWDDDAHLIPEGMRSTEGLRRIWLDIGATQQYYPVVYTAFWLFARLWGDATLGYHLANIGFHATSALLLFFILRHLRVPGALLATTLFALHPIQVESVAWMSELKNTLSTALGLASLLAYLRFDETRSRRMYVVAFGLFLLALLSKTVTAVLPAGLLVVFWWKRGTVTWKGEIRPLVPFLVLGVLAGLMTATIERTLLGAYGAEYALSPLERTLLAARALVFYTQKLLWPQGLAFMYPRWTIDLTAFAPYLVAVLAVFGAAWLVRRRTRAPLAVLLLYAGALVPALGFVNIYPFRYSYVADHFAYLASIPLLSGMGAVIVLRIERLRPSRQLEPALAAAFSLLLGVLTWQQSRMYTDSETLFRDTLARNPECWLCYNNLATARLHGSEADLAQAIEFIDEALRINPLSAEAHNNRGGALQRQGRLDEALRAHEEAARLNPALVDARYNIGVVHQASGRLDPAADAYRAVLARRPEYAPAHYNLATILLQQGRRDAALAHLRDAARLQPGEWQAHATLGELLLESGRIQEAIVALRDAVSAAPDNDVLRAEARTVLGTALVTAGRTSEALAEFREAARLQPESADAWTTLGLVALEAGAFGEAETALRRAVHQDPGSADIRSDLGAALAALGRWDEAVEQFETALRLQPDHAVARTRLAEAREHRRR